MGRGRGFGGRDEARDVDAVLRGAANEFEGVWLVGHCDAVEEFAYLLGRRNVCER
jgi:hypothetical protein